VRFSSFSRIGLDRGFLPDRDPRDWLYAMPAMGHEDPFSRPRRTVDVGFERDRLLPISTTEAF
jgi:hypothetical protein